MRLTSLSAGAEMRRYVSHPKDNATGMNAKPGDGILAAPKKPNERTGVTYSEVSARARVHA